MAEGRHLYWKLVVADEGNRNRQKNRWRRQWRRQQKKADNKATEDEKQKKMEEAKGARRREGVGYEESDGGRQPKKILEENEETIEKRQLRR